MRQKITAIAIVAGGLIAATSPAALSFYIAYNEGLRADQNMLDAYAKDALQRSDEVSRQMQAAFSTLFALEEIEGSCGPRGQAEMRRYDLSSSYIQAIGKVSGTQMQCSSLGLSGPTMELGPVHAVHANGTRLRLDVSLPFIEKDTFLVVERYGHAAIIHKDLPIDTALGDDRVSLATFSKSNGLIFTSRGYVNPGWVHHFLQTGERHFVEDAHLVSIKGSNEHQIASLAAMPLATLGERYEEASPMLVPFSLAAGLLILGFFFLLLRRQNSTPALIRTALRGNEFFLVYQPVVDLRTGRWVGAEALMRWQRPTGEWVRPDTFIPLAEQHGLIGLITKRVFELVGRDALNVFADRKDFHLALNLATDDIYSSHVVQQLDTLSALTRASPGNLIVEITERSFIDSDKAGKIIDRIRNRGVTVAVDDFGTGYSNIRLLQSLNLDYLKIDKSFVESVNTDTATSGVIRHIVSMAKSLELEMIAEGVETEEQATALREMGVNLAQGWLFSKPIPFEQLIAGLAKQSG